LVGGDPGFSLTRQPRWVLDLPAGGLYYSSEGGPGESEKLLAKVENLPKRIAKKTITPLGLWGKRPEKREHWVIGSYY